MHNQGGVLKLVIVHFVFALLSCFIFALLPSNQVWLIVYSCFILFVLFAHLCCVPSVLYSLVIDTGHKCSWEHPYLVNKDRVAYLRGKLLMFTAPKKYLLYVTCHVINHI